MALRLALSIPCCGVQVRSLAGDTALCSKTGHITLTVSLSTQVYKWRLGSGESNAGSNPAMN